MMTMEPKALEKSANKLGTKNDGSAGIFWKCRSDGGGEAVP